MLGWRGAGLTCGDTMKKFLAMMAVAALTACGGGGDDENPAPSYFNGTYTGNLAKTQDNCYIGGQYNSGAAHVLRTEGPEVVVTINTITTRGIPNESGVLEATYEASSDGVTTRVITRYATPAGSEPGAAFNTTVTIQGISQPNGFTCNLTYAGTVYRN